MFDVFCEGNFDRDILKYTNSELMWIRRQMYRALYLDEENHIFLTKQEVFLGKIIMKEYKEKKRQQENLDDELNFKDKIQKSVSTLSLFSGTSETSIISSISLLVYSSVVCHFCSKPLGKLINRGKNCKKCKIILCKNCIYDFEWCNGKCYYCIECFAEMYLNNIKYGIQPKLQNKNMLMGGTELRKKIIIKIDSELEKRFIKRSEEISNFCNAMERQIKIEEKCNKIRNGPIESSNLLSVPIIMPSMIGRNLQYNESKARKQKNGNEESVRKSSYQGNFDNIYDVGQNFLSDKIQSNANNVNK
ncbi:Zinc finger, FYVE/PHD-type domain and Zinc finger, RING/FYVE/PHD-type domain-containing protein [Strongyloides ratti]|uniref:Zinc finger, FYVE/PHD-type domain and Zinc finger, RING/FYVE/PHD-type domain-containing protein n=1 Tax=Strongyloides ratti TaxID=34506 RepID=A0A090LC78_STRRB|nr:Zinc finger, FYVE/PHD-type domain and Zinc finger, RING/FYVE/PHD-type domain-containing protein [Strongyloides ratti]CEF67377.1 Zinc finger, FYVE/PHD-type domain and Zinc finger, RING/FYVE/PHD-type domain-containing protein [Strongyloides ratti]